MKVSIVIVTYFSSQLINDCIKSIVDFCDLELTDLEIIIVDNSNDEKEFLYLKNIDKKFGVAIKILNTGSNLGYGTANNIGISNCSSNIVYIMNPDVRIDSSIFKKVNSVFENNKNIGLIGFKQFGGKNISFYFNPEFFFPIFSNFLMKISNHLNYFNSRLFFISGAFFAFDKKKIPISPFFDENIFLYGEEADIAKKIKKLNKSILYLYDLKYTHLINLKNSNSNNSYSLQIKSEIYYLKKYELNAYRYIQYQIIDSKIKFLVYKLFRKNNLVKTYTERISFLNEFKKGLKNEN